MNLARLIGDPARERPDALALTFEGQAATFAQVERRVEALAGALDAAGVAPGDRVMLVLPNVPEHLLLWLATFKRGAVVVPVNARLTPAEIGFIASDCDPALVVLAAPPSVELEAALGDGRTWMTVAGEDRDAPHAIERRIGPERAGVPPVEVAPTTVAVIAYTSGTTGRPKGVMQSHRAILIAIDGLRDWFQLGADDPLLCMLPLYALPAMLGGPLLGWRAQAAVHLMRGFESSACARELREHRPAMIGAVPTMLFDLAALPPEDVDLSSVRTVLSGGAPLMPAVREELERRFDLRMCNVYGQTEAPAVVAADALRGERPVGTVGRPLRHIAITIRDADDVVLGPGQAGEICVGPATPGSYEPMLGYLGRPEATATALRGGVLHTGDMGYLDDEGLLHFVDRGNDVIVRGGINVYPAEVERVLDADERIVESAVVAFEDQRLGEVPVAFVVPAEGARLTEADVLSLLRSRLAPFKHPVACRFRDALPKNAMGKVLRRVLRDEIPAAPPQARR